MSQGSTGSDLFTVSASEPSLAKGVGRVLGDVGVGGAGLWDLVAVGGTKLTKNNRPTLK